MLDRDDDEQAPTGKAEQDILTELETVTFHLSSLYQRLSQDRDSWAVTGGDLASAVGELQQHLQKFATLESTLRQQIAKSIQQESKIAAATVSDAIKHSAKEALDKQIGHSSEHLDNVVGRAHSVLIRYEREFSHVKLWYLALIMVGALLGGGIGTAATLYVAGGGRQARIEQSPVTQETVRKPRAAKGN